ncbi:MAG: hypothetical protein K1X57_09040, partial [Gemmataceae bacterium]|nr:hypothetical protein [Gemmataceae bacterium]
LADDKARPKPADAAKAAVSKFYSNIAEGKAVENSEMFFSADVPVTGTMPHEFQKTPGRTLWRKSAKEYLESHGKKPNYLKVDSIMVDLVHDGLATARISYRKSGQSVHAAAAVIFEAGHWRIASLFEESFFIW